jgi:hypothetical protein
MWSGIAVVALVAITPAAALLVDATGADEKALQPIVVAAPPAGAQGENERELVIAEGISQPDAMRAARAAQQRYGGRALTVDRDGAGYEVEVQRADGRLVEVLVDRRFRVLSPDY